MIEFIRRRLYAFRLTRTLGGSRRNAWRALLTGCSGRFRSTASGMRHGVGSL